MLKLFRMIKKGRFVTIGKGKALFQPPYIDDVVDGFLLCLKNDQAIGEAFILGGEEYVSLEVLVSLIPEKLKVSVSNLRIPLAPVLWAASLCEKICAPLGVEPPLHRRRVSFFQNNRAFSVAKAKNLLGYRSATSLKEGIRKTIQWYEAEGWL